MVFWLVFAVKKYFVRYRWTVCYSTCKKSPKQSVHSTLILIQLYCNFFFFLHGRVAVCVIIRWSSRTFHTQTICFLSALNKLSAFLSPQWSVLKALLLQFTFTFFFQRSDFFSPIVDFYSKCSIGLQSTHVWWQCVSAVSLTKALHSHFFCNTVVGKTLEGFHVLEAARAILYWFLVENIFMMWINKISEEIDIIFIYTGGGGRSSQKLLSITSPKP